MPDGASCLDCCCLLPPVCVPSRVTTACHASQIEATMNLNKSSISTVDVSGKRVLMRVDCVPWHAVEPTRPVGWRTGLCC